MSNLEKKKGADFGAIFLTARLGGKELLFRRTLLANLLWCKYNYTCDHCCLFPVDAEWFHF